MCGPTDIHWAITKRTMLQTKINKCPVSDGLCRDRKIKISPFKKINK